MLYITLCIALIIILLPFAWSLAGFVYRRPASKLKVFRKTPALFFYGLFAFGLFFYFAFFLTLFKTVSSLTVMNVRLLVGCTVAFICVLFFLRLIPVYYADDADVQSCARYKTSFLIELACILLFTAALETVSFNVYAYIISGTVGAFLLGLRLRKLFALRKKYGRKNGG